MQHFSLIAPRVCTSVLFIISALVVSALVLFFSALVLAVYALASALVVLVNPRRVCAQRGLL